MVWSQTAAKWTQSPKCPLLQMWKSFAKCRGWWIMWANSFRVYLPSYPRCLSLLRKETTWVWGKVQEQAFRKAKAKIAAAPALCYYDTRRPTVASADASSYDLGAALLQDHEGKLRAFAFCSLTFTDAKKRYSQIGKKVFSMCVGLWVFPPIHPGDWQSSSSNRSQAVGAFNKHLWPEKDSSEVSETAHPPNAVW